MGNKQESPVSWPEAFQNTVIVSMANGWLIILVIPIFFLLLFWLVPDTDKRVMLENVATSSVFVWGGWVTNVILISGWFFHVRWQVRKYEEEISRLSAERTELQKSQIPKGRATSSKKKKDE